MTFLACYNSAKISYVKKGLCKSEIISRVDSKHFLAFNKGNCQKKINRKKKPFCSPFIYGGKNKFTVHVKIHEIVNKWIFVETLK